MSAAERFNPYVGPSSFSAGDAHLFFGREREAESLLSLVISESIVLFFAPSGTGKTSLIRARLERDLKNKGFDVLPIVRVGAEIPPGLSPGNVYVFNALRSLADPQSDPARLQHLTLSAYLWTLPSPGDRHRVLILDQFEEILSTHPRCWKQREDFFLDLRQALEDEPSLSVLLVVREDNLAGLETYAPLLPGRLRTRFGMESLRFEDAVKAVSQPAKVGGRPFEKEEEKETVAEQLVNNLRQVRLEGEDATYSGEFVEPMQLQVVCYQLWEKLQERPGPTITGRDLVDFGDIGQALESFYERSAGEASQKSGISEAKIRQWCGRALITPRTKIRCQVSWEPEATAGLRNDAVKALLDTKLIREQPVRGGIWYELVHDRFIDPVLRVNERFQQMENTPLRRDVRLWDLAGRDPSYLYRGLQLAEALKKVDSEALTDVEKDFLSESQAAKQRRLIEQRAAARKLMFAFLAAFVVTAFFAGYSMSANRLSKSRELAARAANQLAVDPDKGLRLAVDAVETAVTSEAESALYAALNASRVRRFWSASSKSANAVAFSPDGKRLAVVGDDGSAVLWNVRRGRVFRVLKGHTEAVNSVAFSPDGLRLATADSAGNVIVRDAVGEPLKALFLGKVNVNGLAFSPDGKILAIASDSLQPRLWSFETGQRRDLVGPDVGAEDVGEHQDVIWDVTFSSDGLFLATGDDYDRVVVWDLAKGTSEVVGEQAAPVTGVAFRPGRRGEPPTVLASSSQDGTARLWDLRSHSSEPLWGHKGWVWSVAFSLDGEYLATASFDHTAKLWDVSSRQELFTLSPSSGEVAKVAFSPEQSLLATASHSADGSAGRATVWRVLFQDEAKTISMNGSILGLAFTKEDKLLAATDRSSWCQSAGTPLSMSFTQGGDFVICTALDGTIFVKPLAELGSVPRLPAETGRGGASYNPEGKRLATLSPRGGVDLWVLRGATWQRKASYLAGRPTRSVAFSGDGERLAVGNSDGTTFVLSTSTGEALKTLSRHQGSVRAVAFSADGTRLATGSSDRTAKLWDLDTGTEIAGFEGHRAAVTSVAFDVRGKWLATADENGQIRQEALDVPTLIARAQKRLSQSLQRTSN